MIHLRLFCTNLDKCKHSIMYEHIKQQKEEEEIQVIYGLTAENKEQSLAVLHAWSFYYYYYYWCICFVLLLSMHGEGIKFLLSHITKLQWSCLHWTGNPQVPLICHIMQNTGWSNINAIKQTNWKTCLLVIYGMTASSTLCLKQVEEIKLDPRDARIYLQLHRLQSHYYTPAPAAQETVTLALARFVRGNLTEPLEPTSSSSCYASMKRSGCGWSQGWQHRWGAAKRKGHPDVQTDDPDLILQTDHTSAEPAAQTWGNYISQWKFTRVDNKLPLTRSGHLMEQ